MRKEFFDKMDQVMEGDKRIHLIFAGLGYPRYDEFVAKYPDRVINVEAAEQTALDIAVGLASLGRIPFVYTITPFYWRGAETIRTYIAHENHRVVMCGAGRDDDYKDDGFSHDGTDIGVLMNGLKIPSYYPKDNDEMLSMVDGILKSDKPSYLSLRR